MPDVVRITCRSIMKIHTPEEIRGFVSKPLFSEAILADKDPSYPKITIVTPSYGQGAFLERTILSVLNQNYPNLEYIVIDGGSSDGSVEIIRKYGKYLAYWVSEKDSGQADAISKGFAKGSGDILGWLNSDDVYLPGALHTIAVALSRERSCNVAYGNMYWIDELDRIIDERRQTPFMRLGYLYGGFDLPQPATFWRKEIYTRARGIDSTYHFSLDTDLFYRFACEKARMKFVRCFIACFRVHSSSKTSTVNIVGKRDNAKIHALYLSFPYDSFRGAFIRNLAKVRRILWYVGQGDFFWLFRKLVNRLPVR
jgi:glycosyltransferase involved in cell wall biosynthesis